MKIKQASVTKLAKAIYASHSSSALAGGEGHKRRIPWRLVESFWADASTTERAHYRWEATQVLRTLRAAPSESDPR